MSRIQININPEILRWAREEAGYAPSEIAHKADIALDRYKQWENEGKNIPLGKLKVVANAFKRQLAVFLLPTVPEKIIKPKDFRNLSPDNSILSKKVLEVLRDVTYFRDTAIELQGETYWHERYRWMNEIKTQQFESKEFYDKLREILGIDIEEQMDWSSDNEAYRNWRLAVEDRLGIFVFQFSMPMDEIEGFCLTDRLPFTIVTNSNHTYTGRIFTIFHELAHILENQSGMCLLEKVNESQRDEWQCNVIAGRLLVPDYQVKHANDLMTISQYASKLKVSREMYLRRLKEEKKISDHLFFDLLEQIKSTYRKEKKKSGFVRPEIQSRATRGETFFNMILDAMYSDKISYIKASNVLNLNISKIFNEI